MDLINYEAFDRALADGEAAFDAQSARLYVEGAERHPLRARMEAIKRFSMLHVDTLMLLRAFSLASRGAVLEIGTYIGGSSAAIALGLEGDRQHFAVEPGGAYPDQPFLPTDDILSDWRKNMTEQGLIDKTTLLVGYSNTPSVMQTIRGDIRGGIGLLFVDANGLPATDFQNYADLLRPDCLVVIDEYESPHESVDLKALPTREFVEKAEAAGALESFGVYPWGTWFGRVGRTSITSLF